MTNPNTGQLKKNSLYLFHRKENVWMVRPKEKWLNPLPDISLTLPVLKGTKRGMEMKVTLGPAL